MGSQKHVHADWAGTWVNMNPTPAMGNTSIAIPSSNIWCDAVSTGEVSVPDWNLQKPQAKGGSELVMKSWQLW